MMILSAVRNFETLFVTFIRAQVDNDMKRLDGARVRDDDDTR